MTAVDTPTDKPTTRVFWKYLWGCIQGIPRAAILSLIGPAILLLVGYMGWRYYGAKALDVAFYAIKPENIHLSSTPSWLKTDLVNEVFEGSNLGKLSLLDDQSSAMVARAFDAHPWVRKTHRVQRMAGNQILVSVEYRVPIAMVHCDTEGQGGSGTETKESFLPIDAEGVLLPTKDFTQSDIPNYLLIYTRSIRTSDHRRVGTPLGDSQVENAILLCRELVPFREEANLIAVYVYPARVASKTKWMLELATRGGPRIIWGSAPGLEGRDEPSFQWKLKRLREITSQKDLWSQPEFDLSRLPDNPHETKSEPRLTGKR